MNTIYRALHSRNYRLYFAGQLISVCGTWMQQVALSWLTYRLTGSTFMLGLVTFVGQIPTLFLAPIGGLLSDRYSRRTMLIQTQFCSLVHAATLALLVFTVELQSWHLVALALILGLINSIDAPIRQSFVAELVDRREDIPNAIALNSFTINASRFVGPAIGGVVVAVLGEGVCFALNAVSYLAVISALLAMRLPRTQAAAMRLRAAVFEGFQYVLDHRQIRLLILMVATVSFFGTPYATLLPYFAKEVYAGGAQAFGYMSAAAGGGACFGTLFLATRKNAPSIDGHIGKAAYALACALLAFACSNSLIIAIPALAVLGFCSINVIASSNALIQSMVADEIRGRVMSIFAMAFMGISPLGSLAVGYASQHIGARFALIGCAVAILITVLGVSTSASRLLARA